MQGFPCVDYRNEFACGFRARLAAYVWVFVCPKNEGFSCGREDQQEVLILNIFYDGEDYETIMQSEPPSR